MSEPDAPEFHSEKARHFSWWRTIWTAQAARGMAVAWAEPEHGPPPYLQTLPYTCQPVADLWDVNRRVAQQVREQHAQAMAA